VSLRPKEQTAEELTWAMRSHDNEIDSITELGEKDDRKTAAKPLVPLGYGIYPKSHAISARIHLGSERMARP
jgi:hypothetical protein